MRIRIEKYVAERLDSRRFSGVAHVFNRMEPGGAELRTIEVVSRFDATFGFVAVSGLPGRLDGTVTSSGHRLHLERLSLLTVPRYVSLFRRNNYRVVHSHLGLASGAVVLAAWLAGAPKRIVHFRSDAVGGRKSLKKSLYLAVSRLLIRALATDLVGVSAGSLEHAWSHRWSEDSRCIVIPNGFDSVALRKAASLEQGSRPAQGTTVVANVGRPDPVKNRGRAIQIWKQLAAARDTQLLLVGALNEQDERLAVAARGSDYDSVLIVGDTDRVADYLGMSDVLIATSKREGLPGVVLEALCLGVPVVATRLPGTEWIASEVKGVRLLSLDDPDEKWIDALIQATTTDRNSIMQSFDASPFTIERAVRDFAVLWGMEL